MNTRPPPGCHSQDVIHRHMTHVCAHSRWLQPNLMQSAMAQKECILGRPHFMEVPCKVCPPVMHQHSQSTTKPSGMKDQCSNLSFSATTLEGSDQSKVSIHPQFRLPHSSWAHPGMPIIVMCSNVEWCQTGSPMLCSS